MGAEAGSGGASIRGKCGVTGSPSVRRQDEMQEHPNTEEDA